MSAAHAAHPAIACATSLVIEPPACSLTGPGRAASSLRATSLAHSVIRRTFAILATRVPTRTSGSAAGSPAAAEGIRGDEEFQPRSVTIAIPEGRPSRIPRRRRLEEGAACVRTGLVVLSF
jgi:hypothetical protein